MKKPNNLTFYLKSRTTIILLLFIVYILLHLLFLFIIEEDVNIMGVIAAPNLTPILFFNTILVVIVGDVANSIY
jgi:hypothetical protein